MSILKLFMYGMFGFVAAEAGIGIMTKPTTFIILLILLISIDTISFINGRNS